MERISVVIPVYNAYNYLEKCLKSVINQSYPNLEIILINDCSSDDSESICKRFVQDYSNVFYYKLSQNKGVAYARNFGINNSTGSLIAFVDSDDYIDIDMYYNLVNIMIKYNANIVASGFNIYQVNETTSGIDSEFGTPIYLQLVCHVSKVP